MARIPTRDGEEPMHDILGRVSLQVPQAKSTEKNCNGCSFRRISYSLRRLSARTYACRLIVVHHKLHPERIGSLHTLLHIGQPRPRLTCKTKVGGGKRNQESMNGIEMVVSSSETRIGLVICDHHIVGSSTMPVGTNL